MSDDISLPSAEGKSSTSNLLGLDRSAAQAWFDFHVRWLYDHLLRAAIG